MAGNCCNRQMPDGSSHLECLDPLWISASPDPRYPVCGQPGGSGTQPPVDGGAVGFPPVVEPSPVTTTPAPVGAPTQGSIPTQPLPQPQGSTQVPIKTQPAQATPAPLPLKPVEKKPLDTGSAIGIGAVLLIAAGAVFFGGK